MPDEEIPHNGKISPMMTIIDIITLLSQGNPGAVNVMGAMFRAAGSDVEKQAEAFMHLLNLDDMALRGDMIWIAFKYHCGMDMDRFKDCLTKRDPAMVKAVNDLIVQDEPDRKDRAVCSGASQ